MIGNRESLTHLLSRAIHYSVSDAVPYRSGCVALVVETILNLINQRDAIFGAPALNWSEIVLAYCVLYAVSRYGAVSYRLSRPQARAPAIIPLLCKASATAA